MSKTDAVLLEIIRSVLLDTPLLSVPEELKDEEFRQNLLGTAKKHDLAHFVGLYLKKNGLAGSDDTDRLFAASVIRAKYRYGLQQNALEEICRVLEDEKIPFIPLKGSVIRNFYPEPFMRTSGDIDILVKEKNLDAAVRLLCGLGFCAGERQSHDISLFSQNGVHAELHFRLIEYDRRVENLLDTVWESAVPARDNSCERLMSPEFFVLYHIAHMAKHFAHGGCGIRTFMDLSVIDRRIAYDRKGLSSLLEACRLLRFFEESERLANVWFGGESHDGVTAEMENYILRAGVYGSVKNMVSVSQAKKGSRWQHVLSRVFIKYDVLKQQYPLLSRHKVLLPLYEVKRWVKYLRSGGAKRAKNELGAGRSASDEGNEGLRHMLDGLGMLDNDMI